MKRQSEASDDPGLRVTRGFGSNPGALRMLTYVPDGLAPNAALVVVLHGCSQRAGAHARAAGWLTLADRLGFAVLAPEQERANNPNLCFNWFEPADIARGSGEAASIHAMVQHMLRTYALDPARVFITGLSAGGAMTSVLLATYPETFAAGAVVAGLPFGLANNAREAFAAMRGGSSVDSRELAARVVRAAPAPPRKPRLAIWHGQADHTVASSNASALARQWAAYHGLSAEPAEVLARPGRTRSVWRGADGSAVIELNLLAGFGHGTPLAAGGHDPIGELAPFMLEAGVSASLEIARFWGLAPAEETSPATEALSAGGREAEAAEPRAQGIGEGVMAAVSPHVPEDLRRIIAKALALAGL